MPGKIQPLFLARGDGGGDGYVDAVLHVQFFALARHGVQRHVKVSRHAMGELQAFRFGGDQRFAFADFVRQKFGAFFR